MIPPRSHSTFYRRLTCLAVSLAIVVFWVGRHWPISLRIPQKFGAWVNKNSDALPVGAVARLGSKLFLPLREVWQVAISPDAKTIATGSAPWADVSKVELWDAATGRKWAEFADIGYNIIGLAWSPDGQRLAVSVDYGVQIWDLATLRQIAKLERLNDAPRRLYWSLRWSADQRFLVATQPGSHLDPSRVYVWDSQTYQLVAHWTVRHELHGVAISDDGEWVAACGKSVLEVRNRQTSEIRFDRAGFRFDMYSVAFSPDGTTLAAGVDAGESESSILFVDAQTGNDTGLLGRFSGTDTEVAYSPDGKTIASGGSRGVVRLWDVESQSLRAEIKSPGQVGRYFSISRNGQTLVTADRRWQLWDMVTGKPQHEQVMQFLWANSAAFISDGRLVTTGSGDQTVQTWRLQDGVRQSRTELPGKALVVSPDGETVASAETESRILISNVKTGERVSELALRNLLGTNKDVSRAVFSASGKLLASAHFDNMLRVWNVEERRIVMTIECALPVLYVRSLHFSLDDKILASGLHGKPVVLWDLEKKAELGAIPDSATELGARLAFCPDNRSLIVPKPSKPLQPPDPLIKGAYLPNPVAIRRWDFRRGQELWTSEAIYFDLNGTAVSPDDKLLALTLRMRGEYPQLPEIHIRDAQTGRPLGKLPGHSDGIHELYFSPDSSRLVSASYDTTMLVWDMEPFR